MTSSPHSSTSTNDHRLLLLRVLGATLVGALLAAFPSTAHAQDSTTVEVKDAGSTIVNGSYTCVTDGFGNCESFSGHAKYEKDSNTSIKIRWSSVNLQWEIQEQSAGITSTYYRADTTDQLFRPPEEGWDAGFSGTAPAPSLSYGVAAGSAPTAYTDPASDVFHDLAKLNGRVQPGDTTTTVYFFYGETGGSLTQVEADQSPITGTSEQSVDVNVLLAPDTEYRFYVKAENEIGTDQGQERTFTTNPEPPTVTTNEATNLTSGGAQLNGTVDDPGGASVTVRFEYWPTGSPGSSQQIEADQSPVSSTESNVAVDASVSGLSSNTDYTFQVVASNSDGGVNVGSKRFFTTAPPLSATTGETSSVSSNEATLEGTVQADGDEVTASFEYWPTGSPGSAQTVAATQDPFTDATEHFVSATVSGLMEQTDYTYRVTATSGLGTAKGADSTFTTPPTPPEGVQLWQEKQIVRGPSPSQDDELGRSVAIDGDRAIVGVPQEDGDTEDEGAAYILKLKSDGTWSQEAVLRGSFVDKGYEFGHSVAISGDQAIVGQRAGEPAFAYIFERQSDGTWAETAVLGRSDFSEYFDLGFGQSVAITSDHAIAGGYLASDGGAYIYNRAPDGSWGVPKDSFRAETQLIRPAKNDFDDFGEAVAMNSNWAIVGDPHDDGPSNNTEDTGAAYILKNQADDTWAVDTILRGSEADKGDAFGRSVAISGDQVIFGAPSLPGAGSGGPNEAYIFEHQADGWSELQLLSGSNAFSGDGFATSLAMDGDRVIVGARLKEAAYIFERTFDDWPATETQFIRSSNHEDGDSFASSVALDGDQALVGATLEDGTTNDIDYNSGAVYALERTSFPSLTVTDGGTGNLDFNARISPGTDDNPVGLFRLVSDQSGATFEEASITNENPGVTGITQARLYQSSDPTFDPGSDAVLDSFDVSDSGAEQTFSFSGFNRPVPTSGGYVFLTIDAQPDVNTNVQFTLNDEMDLGVAGGDLGMVNGQMQDTFAALPLSASTTTPTTTTSQTISADETRDFGGTGASLNFSGVTNAGDVTVNRYDEGPESTSGITESNVSSYRLTIETESTLDFTSYQLQIAVSEVPGITDPSKVTIYKRDTVGVGDFSALTTTVGDNGTAGDVTDDTLYASTYSFSEFAIASDSEPLPVEMAGFDAQLGDGSVQLSWSTTSETGNAGFRIQRRLSEEEGAWTKVGSVDGAGTTSEAQSYQFTDGDLPYEADALTYRLKQVDTDGSASFSETVTVERGVTEVQLLGTYPNPAHQQATLRYALPEKQDVTVRLYDVLGRQVRTVVSEKKEGRHEQTLEVSGLSSGVYFLRLRSQGTIKTQKLTVVR